MVSGTLQSGLNKQPWLLGICFSSVPIKDIGMRIILPRWWKGHEGTGFIPCAQKTWCDTTKCFLYVFRCLSAESYFDMNTIPLSNSFHILKVQQDPFTLRAPSVVKAPFPSPCHFPTFWALYSLWPSLCFLAILNWHPLCLISSNN